MWNLALIGPVVSEKKTFEVFSLYESMKNKWSLWPGHFGPQGYNLNNLGRGPLNTKYQRAGPSSFRQEDFQSFAYRSLCKNIWPFHKKGQVQPKVIFFQTLLAHCPNAAYQAPRHRPFGSGEEDFLGFLPYMGVATILVMSPRYSKQTLFPPTHWGSMWNLALFDPVVSEKKMFKVFSLYESMKKKWPLWSGHFWPQGFNLNNLGRSSHDKATHYISKAWTF